MGDCPTPRTYFVVSEETMVHPGDIHGVYGNPEPPEYGRFVDEVKARSKREAIRVAYADPESELRLWAKKNRADGRHPFAGLTVEHPHCDHGVCLDRCEDGDPTTVCKPCDDEEQWVELCDEVGCDLPVWDVDRWVPCWECERCDVEHAALASLREES